MLIELVEAEPLAEELDAEAAGQVLAQRLHAITLGGMVAAGEVGHTAFAGVVGLWLGNFTGDKEIGSSGNGTSQKRTS